MLIHLKEFDSTRAMNRKDGESYTQAIFRDLDPEVKLYNQVYLHYLENPLTNMDYVWEDNKSMINSLTVPEAKLHKRHNILLFHYVRSMVSQGYIIQHISST